MVSLVSPRAGLRNVLFIDALIAVAGVFCSPVIRLGGEAGYSYVWHNLHSLALVSLAFVLSFLLADIYRPSENSVLRSAVNVGIAVVIAEVIAALLFYVYWPLRLGRGVMLLSGCLIFVGVATRHATYSAIRQRFRMRCLMVELDKSLMQLTDQIESHPLAGIELVGLVSKGPIRGRSEGSRDIVIESWKDLLPVAEQYRTQCIVTHLREGLSSEFVETLIACARNGMRILDVIQLYEDLTGRIHFREIQPYWFLYAALNRSNVYALRIKRLLDIILSVIALAVTSPVFAVVLIANKVSSRGPVFYGQDRVGQFGKPFCLLKFRSMVNEAENETGPVWSHEGDLRVTRLGGILRRYRIDELPQLINVIKGDMSLVGPRPERPEIIFSTLDHIPYYMNRVQVKPGLTGWAQINYPYASSVDETERKLEYDFFYVKNASFSLDIFILLRTFRVILTARG